MAKRKEKILRDIFSFIFDKLTDPLTLPIEPLYEWILLGVIGLIAYVLSFRIVGDMLTAAVSVVASSEVSSIGLFVS